MMEVRNALRNTDESFVCEVNHDLYGWIPYTAANNTGDAEMQAVWDELNSSGVPDASAPPALVPQSVTDIQFALASVTLGLMTAQEAEDWVGAGVLPAATEIALQNILDPVARVSIRIRIRGARVIERNSAVIDFLGSQLGLTNQQVDEIFILAVSL